MILGDSEEEMLLPLDHLTVVVFFSVALFLAVHHSAVSLNAAP